MRKIAHFQIIATIAVLMGASPVFAFAQTEQIQSASEKVSESVEKLLKFGDPGTDLELRRQALIEILNLSKSEIEEVSKKIRKAPPSIETPLSQMQAFLLEKLRLNSLEIGSFLQKTEAAQSSDEVKEIAASFASWRKKEYDPIIKNTLDLSVIFRAREVLNLVGSRLRAVTLDVQKIEEVFSFQAAPLRTELTLASVNIRDANSAYQRAKDIYLKESGLVLEKGSALAEELSTGEEPLKNELSQVQQAASQVIESVRKAYQAFLTMSGVAKKLLQIK